MKKDKFPWHASSSDSLELELFVPPFNLRQFSEAFTVHPPNELPMLLSPYSVFEFSGRRHIEVLITPTVIRSDESLKNLEPSERLCYFEGERMLRFFKTYTKRNCEIERWADFIESDEYYSCVHFGIVRGPDSMVCGRGRYDSNKRVLPPDEQRSYDCFPPCNSVSYEITITESKLRKDE